MHQLRHRIVEALIATGTYRPLRFVQRHTLERRQEADFRQMIDFYRPLVRSGELCFDVGANRGEVTEALLTLGARVVAFEPQIHMAREVEARCAHMGDLTVVRCALSDGAGFATLNVRQTHGRSGFREDGDWEGRTIERRVVPTLTLDAAIAEFGTPRYVKIDVEGWEPHVFAGVTASLPLVSFEYHRRDDNIRDTLGILRRLQELGAQRVNLTPCESAEFRFTEWMPIADFLTWFPGQLPSEPSANQGDIYVAM